MATSRGGTPANPTLVATTDDAARGGLFARSNLGNTSGSSPTTGVDTHLESVSFNEIDRILSLVLTDGETLTVEIPGGNGTTGPTVDTFITGVSFDANTGTLSLMRNDSRTLDVHIPTGGLTTNDVNQLINNAINNLPDPSFSDLTDTPSSLGSAGQSVRVNQAGSALEFFTPTGSGINMGEFSSTGNTVAITDNSGLVNLESRPAIAGNAAGTVHNANALTGNTVVNFTEFRVDSTALPLGRNGRQLVLVNNNGVITLTEDNTAPPSTPTPSGSVRSPAPTNIFMRAADQTVTINLNNVMTIGTPMVTASGPSGSITVDPSDVTVNASSNNQGSVDIVIDMSDVGNPGTYEVDATIPTTDENGMSVPVQETAMFDRIIPYVQVRGTEPTTSTDLGAPTADRSTTEWPANNSFTATSGSGPLYIAIDASENIRFRQNTAGQDAVLVTVGANEVFARVRRTSNTIDVISGSVTTTYNVYQFGGSIPSGATVAFAT